MTSLPQAAVEAAASGGGRERLIQALSRVVDPLVAACEHGVVWIGIALVAITGLQVVLRYCFNAAFFGAEELSRFLFVWFTFLAATVALQYGTHFAVDVCVKYLPRPIRHVLARFAQLFVLVLLGVTMYAGGALVLRATTAQSSALDIPLWIPYSAIPVSSVVMMLVTARQLLLPVREHPAASEDYA
jgi:TRAP-type C4-dicarboxylate transport system permease small subunit